MTDDELEPDIGRKNWIAIGLAIGVGLGAFLDNMVIGISLGVIFGGVMNQKKVKEEAKNKE